MVAAWHVVVSELVTDLGKLSCDIDQLDRGVYDPQLVRSIRDAEKQAAEAISGATFDASIDPLRVEASIATARQALARAWELLAALQAEIARSRRIERRSVELSDEAARFVQQSRSLREKRKQGGLDPA